MRRVRQNPNIAIDAADDLAFSDSSDDTVKKKKTPSSRGSSGSASEQVPVKLAFPGNDFEGTRQTTSGSKRMAMYPFNFFIFHLYSE